jgi:tRNA U34 5-carboxymethylaminomethyl modifying GTPase MnmE/TrmE
MKDTICAIGTLVGESSINLVRVSGNDSINIVNKLFDKNLLKKNLIQ